MFRIILILLTCISCGQLTQSLTQDQVKSGGVGFASGYVTAKTVEKVKDSLTPVFAIEVYPSKLCDKEANGLIRCMILPCAFNTEDLDTILEKCVTLETEDSFWAREKKVESLDTAAFKLSSLQNICDRSSECVKFLGEFKDKTIVFVEDKND